MAAEKQFEEKLKAWLESEGIYPLGTPEQDMHTPPCGYWEKRWGGGKYTKAGLPDMHIVVCGVSIEVELKAPNGRPSALQIQKLNQIDDARCMATVLFPKDFPQFQLLVKFIKKNPPSYGTELLVFSGLKRGWR